MNAAKFGRIGDFEALLKIWNSQEKAKFQSCKELNQCESGSMTNRPVLRWHGGKSKLANWIIQHLPAHRCYVEPYSGAASVLMQKGRSRAEIYNDLDSEVVNVFRILRDRGPELLRLVELTPFSRSDFDLCYEATEDPLEKARRMLVRAAFGRASASATSPWKASFRSYSGAARTTTAAQDWANFPQALNDFTRRLAGVVIENKDALELMKEHDSKDSLFYVDPPYVASTRDLAQDYRHEMTEDQHESLADALKSLKGMVVLSGYRCELYDRLYQGWERVDHHAHADGASQRIESLWLSPNVPTGRLL